ncbi:MAG: molybdopterin-dependent oxidoreductase [Alphaproteobacteria bacterium]|nr:molybdopterin-dependent oxidoreductase [Alphaproteobacteria bacterium]
MPETSTKPWHRTACILCHTNCGLAVQLDDGGRHIARVKGDKDHPASKGYTCNKALQIDFYQNGRDRLRAPLRRRPDSTFEEIDWSTAIREIAEKFVAISDDFGGDKIMYYGGGGQGNHLPGLYATGLRQALGIKYRSNALAQEKTGMAWVNQRMFGANWHGDFESCEVAVFVGKNPWQSNGIQRARAVLRQIARDENRSMVVIDPKRTETAELADYHLQVKPGRDAWCLSALLAVIVQEDLFDHKFLAAHAEGRAATLALFNEIDVDEYAGIAGLDGELIRRAARRMATAESMSLYEDLGVEMAPNSTLCSYLNGLLVLVTGNFANHGGANVPTALVPIYSKTKETPEAGGDGVRFPLSPVTGGRILGDLSPCNLLVDEILSDHPNRFRAMFVETANPAHSLADSRRMREALSALEFLVVVDVAMTETAMLADYVLPASSQYEKWEATFFNFEFPKNFFHLRRPLMAPLPGTLPESEIHSRLLEEIGVFDSDELAELADLALNRRADFAPAFFAAMKENPKIAAYPIHALHRTLGPVLPDNGGNAVGLWLSAHICARKFPDSVARAGFTGKTASAGDELFEAVISHPSGLVFSVDEPAESLKRIARPGGKANLWLAEMVEELAALSEDSLPDHDDGFELVLEAGARRDYTAMTTIRDPGWLKSNDAIALAVNPADAAEFGLVDGGGARLSTKRGELEVMVRFNDRMRPGHISLPNGLGLSYPDAAGANRITGTPPNEFTATEDRDAFAATPWHKYVPARLRPLANQ